MKQILIIILGLVSIAYGQSVGQFRYDSTMFLKNGGNNELIILNGTRGVTGGVLTNIGNGRTQFVTPAAGIGTASNGLTKVGSDVKLGGTLTANTTINVDPYDLTLNILGGNFILTSDDAGHELFRIYKDGESLARFQMQTNGLMEWSNGIATHTFTIQPLGTGAEYMNIETDSKPVTLSSNFDSVAIALTTNDGVSSVTNLAEFYYKKSTDKFGLITASPFYMNTGIIPTVTGKDLGAAATAFRDLYLHGSGTYGSHSIKITGSPSGNRTFTLPNFDATAATLAGTETFTNKRWTARVGSTTSSATPTINTDNVDIYKLTAQAVDITSMTTNLSGTPNDGDILEIQITGTALRNITWGASFVSTTVTLPAATDGTNTLTVICQYYTTSSYGNNKWHIVNYY